MRQRGARTHQGAAGDQQVHRPGRAPAPGGLTVEDIVTVVLALSNGLAIELYADPGAVSDGLFGRVLAQLSREARPWACDG